MFTGIIKQVAQVVRSNMDNNSLYLEISTPDGFDIKAGDSVATNGVCLTVRNVATSTYTVELMPETLKLTTFGLHTPKKVNVELPLRLSDRLDGHLVQGHVDAVGQIKLITLQSNAKVYTIAFPGQFKTQLILKGSITVDGVSLTITLLEDRQFSVALLEYTLKHTTLGDKNLGEFVNLEFDMIAKYIARTVNIQSKENKHATRS